ELQDGRGDRDATLLLHLHPVAGRVPLSTTRLHASRQMDRSTVKQQLLGEGGLPRVRVADYGKGPPPADLVCQCAHLLLGRADAGATNRRQTLNLTGSLNRLNGGPVRFELVSRRRVLHLAAHP